MKKMLFFVFCFGLFSSLFAQPVVIIPPFENRGGISSDESEIIMEIFLSELTSRNKVKYVDRKTAVHAMAEMNFQLSDWSNDQKTAELGRALNASSMIRGFMSTFGTRIIITANLVDLFTFENLYSARIQLDNKDEIFDKIAVFVSDLLSNMPNYNIRREIVGKWQPKSKSSRSPTECWYITFNSNGTFEIPKFYARFGSSYLDTVKFGKADFEVTLMCTLEGNISGTFSTTSTTITLEFEFNGTLERYIDSFFTSDWVKKTLLLVLEIIHFLVGLNLRMSFQIIFEIWT